MSPNQTPDPCRAEFEAGYFGNAPQNVKARERSGDGYLCMGPQAAWTTWQLAWHASAKAVKPQMSLAASTGALEALSEQDDNKPLTQAELELVILALRELKELRAKSAPVLYASPEQAASHADPEDGDHARYLPVRRSSAGKFTMPLYAEPQAARPDAPTFQYRVQPWLLACFGEMIAGDREERNHRFLEEALELVQACGCSASEAHQLVDYVFGRPVGEPPQEVGGVMVTLAALCLANGLDMHDAAEVELARIWTKVEAIRAKQAAKPKHSPLPTTATPLEAAYAAALAAKKEVERSEVVSLDEEAFHHHHITELPDIEVGEVVYLGEATKRPASYYLPAPEDIIEQMGNAASDDGGEFAEEFPEVTDDGVKALAVALHRWAEEYVAAPRFWSVDNVTSRRVTAEDLE